MSKNQTAPVVATPVAAVPASAAVVTPKITPVHERRYVLKTLPSIPPKGKQRQIVLAALAAEKTPQTVEQVAKFATTAGLTAVGGIVPSCRYHLHHLVKLGLVTVENPTLETIEPATAEELKEAQEMLVASGD